MYPAYTSRSGELVLSIGHGRKVRVITSGGLGLVVLELHSLRYLIDQSTILDPTHDRLSDPTRQGGAYSYPTFHEMPSRNVSHHYHVQLRPTAETRMLTFFDILWGGPHPEHLPLSSSRSWILNTTRLVQVYDIHNELHTLPSSPGQ